MFHWIKLHRLITLVLTTVAVTATTLILAATASATYATQTNHYIAKTGQTCTIFMMWSDSGKLLYSWMECSE